MIIKQLHKLNQIKAEFVNVKKMDLSIITTIVLLINKKTQIYSIKELLNSLKSTKVFEKKKILYIFARKNPPFFSFVGSLFCVREPINMKIENLFHPEHTRSTKVLEKKKSSRFFARKNPPFFFLCRFAVLCKRTNKYEN